MEGYVYILVQTDDMGLESFKIGISGNPEKRVKTLQTGNPNQIRLLNQYKSENYKKIEGWLHRKYSWCKTNADNEWRNLSTKNVLNFIKDCEEIENTITFLKKNNTYYN